jgi:hypothetical protein
MSYWSDIGCPTVIASPNNFRFAFETESQWGIGLRFRAIHARSNAELSEPGGPAASESSKRVAPPGFALLRPVELSKTPIKVGQNK